MTADSYTITGTKGDFTATLACGHTVKAPLNGWDGYPDHSEVRRMAINHRCVQKDPILGQAGADRRNADLHTVWAAVTELSEDAEHHAILAAMTAG